MACHRADPGHQRRAIEVNIGAALSFFASYPTAIVVVTTLPSLEVLLSESRLLTGRQLYGVILPKLSELSEGIRCLLPSLEVLLQIGQHARGNGFIG